MKNVLVTISFILGLYSVQAQKTDLLLPSEVVREQIIHHSEHSLSYNSSYVLSSWVAYKVTKSQVNKDDKLKPKYVSDPQVNSKSASKKDYKEGGYQMAQLVNYVDVKHSEEAVKESFYMTNIAPMKPAFYKHIWLKTEDLVRLWTIDTDGLYVICGPILKDSPFPTIGDNNVSVPKRYYKAIYDAKNKKAIGFIFKNGMSSGKLNSYTVSIDEIEKETGLDLFQSLDDETENLIEGSVDIEFWNFEVLED